MATKSNRNRDKLSPNDLKALEQLANNVLEKAKAGDSNSPKERLNGATINVI